MTVKQDATVAETLATDKTGGVTATASAKFSALTAGQNIIMGGLTFTASSGMTAAEAAAAGARWPGGSLGLPGRVEDAMADVAVVFHWPLSDLVGLSLADLIDWREHARIRAMPPET